MSFDDNGVDGMGVKRMHNFDIACLCKELGLLIRSGIGAGDSIYVLSARQNDGRKKLFELMGKELDSGKPLYHAFEQAGCFPSYVTGMVKAGEKTGKLEDALMALSQYYEQKDRMDEDIKNALMYPCVLMLIMVAVIVVFMIKVLPVFNDVYSSFGSSLTGPAWMFSEIGKLLGNIVPFLFVLLGIAVVLLIVYVSSETARNGLISWWSKKNGNKGISGKINSARFASVLAMGLSSGLSAGETIELAADMLEDAPEAAEICKDCAEAVNGGKDIIEAIESEDILPAYACRMLEIGLKSGEQDSIMKDISARLEEEASRAVEGITAKIEPVMITVSCGLVGIILLSVMLPLINIMSAIG